MDPITHGFVGAAAGLSLLTRRAPNASRAQRGFAAACGLLSGEFPDVDRVVDSYLQPYGKNGTGLAYMLYHRGPTHSLVACVVVSTGLALIMRRFDRTRAPSFALLFWIAIAGSFLHLAMDAMNDYGVHPFWPVSQRWFYGDFLFLAEPTITCALLPYVLAAFDVPKGWVIGVSALGLMVLVALVIFHQWLMPAGAALAGMWLCAHAFLQRRGPKPVSAWLSIIGVCSVFLAASRTAKARASQLVSNLSPGESLTDVVTTPAPANPFCWRVITLTRRDDVFVARLRVTTFAAALVDPRTCFSPPHGSVPRSSCDLQASPPVTQGAAAMRTVDLTEFRGYLRDFDDLAKANPRVDATRHFLRIPFWGRDSHSAACSERTGSRANEAGAALVIGDLRVDYNPDDVGEFCKYSFVPGENEQYKRWMPLGDPPFLHERRR